MRFILSVFTILLVASSALASELKMGCDNSKTGKREMLVMTSEGDLYFPNGLIQIDKNQALSELLESFPDQYASGVLTGIIDQGHVPAQVSVENRGLSPFDFFIFDITIKASGGVDSWINCAQLPFKKIKR